MEIKFTSNETTKLRDYSGYFVISKNNLIYSAPSTRKHTDNNETKMTVNVVTDTGIGEVDLSLDEDVTPVTINEIQITAMRGYNGKFSKATKNRVI